MRVKILVSGLYSKFGGFKIGAENLKPGDIRAWPDRYANDCISDGYAESVDAPKMAIVVDKSTVETLVADESQDGVKRYKDVVETPPKEDVEIDATDGAKKVAAGFGVDIEAVAEGLNYGRVTVHDVKNFMAVSEDDGGEG